jgi:hypothetical protein
MISFKEYYFINENSLSPKEEIEIHDVGIYLAKVDTGNDAWCVLHGEDIKVDGDMVSFKTDKGESIQKPLVDKIIVNVGAGTEESRPIIEFDITLKGKKYNKVKFSIGDRKDNDEKVLLGLKFLNDINATVQC